MFFSRTCAKRLEKLTSQNPESAWEQHHVKNLVPQPRTVVLKPISRSRNSLQTHDSLQKTLFYSFASDESIPVSIHSLQSLALCQKDHVDLSNEWNFLGRVILVQKNCI